MSRISMPADAEPQIEEIVALQNGEELLVKIPEGYGPNSFVFTILDGDAELLGNKLEQDKDYSYGGGSNLSILSSNSGCTISISRGQKFKLKIIDSSTESNAKMLRDISNRLEDLREIAESEMSRGPIVCLVGRNDSGKSTSCVTLINHAVRKSRRPLYVDLDLGQGNLSVPGSLGAIIVEKTLSSVKDFSQLETGLLDYFVGSNNPGANFAQHNIIISKFAQYLFSKIEEEASVKSSGIIINTCGWVDGAGYVILKHIIESFQVDHVYVMGAGEEHSSLISKLINDDIPLAPTISCVIRSQLICEKTQNYRKEARKRRVHDYFYGSKELKSSLNEDDLLDSYHTFDIESCKITILKLAANVPSGTSSVKLVPVPPSRNLVGHLLGISKLKSRTDDDEIPDDILSLSGYVCVTKINRSNDIMTLLSPITQSSFEEAILLLSDIELPSIKAKPRRRFLN